MIRALRGQRRLRRHQPGRLDDHPAAGEARRLGSEQTLDRKMQEIVLAFRLEKELTKDQILDRYLNTVYFGNGAYGIQAAAETYFGVGVQQLDVGQAALLAGHHPEPERLQPVRYPERAAERAQRRHRAPGRGRCPDRPTRACGGPRCRPCRSSTRCCRPPTTTSSRRSRTAPRRPRVRLPRGHRRRALQVRVLRRPERSTRRSTRRPRPRRRPPATACCRWRTAVFTQSGVVPDNVPRPRGQPNLGSASVVSIEPATGAVRTMVGGPGLHRLRVQPRHPEPAPGRVVVQDLRAGDAHRAGQVAAATSSTARRRASSPNPGGTPGPVPGRQLRRRRRQRRHDHRRHHCARRTAPSCASARSSASRAVVEMAHRLGITYRAAVRAVAAARRRRLPPLEMASAYAALANDGIYNGPYFIDRIEDRDGNVIYSHTPTPEQRVSPQTARLVTEILEQNVHRRHRHPGPHPRPAGRGQDRHDPGRDRRLVRRLHAGAGHRRVDGRPGPTSSRSTSAAQITGGRLPGAASGASS